MSRMLLKRLTPRIVILVAILTCATGATAWWFVVAKNAAPAPTRSLAQPTAKAVAQPAETFADIQTAADSSQASAPTESKPADKPVAKAPVAKSSVAESPIAKKSEPADKPVAKAPVAEPVVEKAKPAAEPVAKAPVAEPVVEMAKPAAKLVTEAPVAEPVAKAPVAETPKLADKPVAKAPVAEKTKSVAKAPVAAKPEPATKPVAKAPVAEKPKPADKPVAIIKPEPKPIAKAPAGEKPKAKDEILFQFDGMPYADVVRRFAQMVRKPIIGDLNIEGELTFFDSEPYEYYEALDTLNVILEMRGFQLMETGRFLRLVPTDNISQMPLPIVRDPNSPGDLRGGQIATVVLPLKYINADDIKDTIERMVSGYGAVSALAKGKGLVITDTMDNIQRIRGLLGVIDTDTLIEQQLRTHTLKHASARGIADVVNRLFGSESPKKTQYDPKRKRSVPIPHDPKDLVSATFDDRTNMLMLVGSSDRLALVEQLIEQLDTKDDQQGGDLRVFQLTNASASELARTLTEALPEKQVGYDTKRKKPIMVKSGKIVADPSTNRLVVSAPVDQMPKIERLVMELDQAGVTAAGARVFPLKVADARQLQSIISSAVQKVDARGRRSSTLAVSADPRTNSLIVSGPTGDIEMAANLIAELDLARQADGREIHVVQLPAGDVRQLASSLMRLFSQQNQPRRGSGQQTGTLRVEAERATNSLMISCAPGDWPQVEAILKQLQATAVPMVTPSTRLIPLAHAKAGEIAQTLREVFRSRGRSALANQVPVVIAFNEQSNSLLVSAAADDQEAISALVAAMDVESAEKVDPVRIIRLKSAEADKVAQTLRQMIPPASRGRPAKVFVQSDSLTNTVLLRAPAAERKMLEEMIAQLDQATRDQARETRLIRLEHASATAVANTLKQLFQTSQPQGGRGRRAPQANTDADRVIITPAPGDRAIIIDAPRQKIEEIAQLVASLDTTDAHGKMQVRTYKLTSGNARNLASSLARVFRKSSSRGQGSAEPEPRFEADPASNQIIVSATNVQFTQIEKLIEQLQVAAVESTLLRTFHLKFAKASEIAKLLRSILAQQGRQPDASPFRVAVLDGANAVAIQASPDKLALAEQLIKQFDAKGTTGQVSIQIIRLKNADATSLADSIRSALAQQPSRSPWRGGGGANQAISITAETNSNSLLVRAPQTEMNRILEMVRELDGESVSTSIEMRVFPLENSEATQLAKSLEKMFRDILRQRSGRRGGKPQAPFSVAANERTNSLVVSTTGVYFPLVEKLLETLDQKVDTQVVDVQYVWLENADATEVAARLESMFAERRKGDRPLIEADFFSNAISVIAKPVDWKTIEPIISKLDDAAKDNNIKIRVIPLIGSDATRMAEVIQRIYGQVSESPIVVTDQLTSGQATPTTQPATDAEVADTSSIPPVTIAVDVQANALIVSGTQRELDNIETLIAQLTASDVVGEPEVRIIPIRNADPAAVAKILNDLFNPKQPRVAPRQSRTRRDARDRQPAPTPAPVKQKIIVVADSRTRSLIVRARPTEFEMIELLIPQLDQGSTVINDLRIFPLKNTDATEVARNLQEIFQLSVSPGRKPAAKGKRTTPTQQRSQTVRQMIEIQQGKGVAQVDSSAPITVAANKQSNSIVVAAPPDAMTVIERIIQELDQSAAASTAPVVRMYPLKNAEVAPTVTAVQQIFDDKAAKGARSQAPRAPVRIAGDEAGRLLIVSAPAGRHELIAKVIGDIDDAQAGDQVAVKVYNIENAEAASIAKALSETITAPAGGGRRKSAAASRISADVSSNSIVVRASQQEHTRIAELIDRMDNASGSVAPSVYVIALKNGDATEVADTVRGFYNQQVQAARRARRHIDPLAVSADTRANAVILATTPKMHAQASQWISQVESMKPKVGTPRIINLKHADPEEVEKAIQQLFGGSSSSQMPSRSRSGRSGRSGRRSNPTSAGRTGRVETVLLAKQRAIMVTANDEDYQAIVKLATSLETAAAGTEKEVRVFQLKNANNTRVAAALNGMYSRAARSGVEEDRVSIVALPQTTALVVTAVNVKMDEIASLITQLDATDVAPQLEFRIYPLEHAMPAKVLPALRQMLSQVQRLHPGEPIDVQADERTRSIIITARGSVFDQVDKIIDTLDKAPAEAVIDVLIIPLKKADAESLAKVLNAMLAPGKAGELTAEARALQEQVNRLRIRSTVSEKILELDLTKPIKIQADPARPQGSNALVIQSTPDNLLAMRAIVELMDTVPVTEGVTVRVLQLKHADAASVSKILQDIFTQGRKLAGREGFSVAGKAEPASTAGKALVNQLNVSPDVRTNMIVLSGQEESVALAEVLTRDLDRQDGKLVTEVRVFRLKHADAERLAPMLGSVFAEKSPAPGAEGLQTHVSRLRTALGNNARTPGLPGLSKVTELAKAREALTIQADPSTNMMVVAARADVMPLIADVIRTMDIPGAGSLNSVKLFPLFHADATRLAKVIDDLHAGPNANLIRDEDKPTISVDTRTNTLIICSSDKTFLMIDALLRQLDSAQRVDLLDVKLLPLKNAEAASLATTLQNMVDARVQRQASLGQVDAEALRVLILADPRSNSLIVGGSVESFMLVKQLAEQLDGASPALGGRIQLYALKEANAGTLSQTLIELFDKRYQAARTPDVQRQKPIIVPDLRTNSLLVAANQDDSDVLSSLLGKLDVPQVDPAVRLVVIPLENNDAGVVGPMIQKMFDARLTSMTAPGMTAAPQDRVDVAIDALSNSLVISASRTNLELIGGLLAKVDVEPPTESGIVRIYALANSDAERVRTMLDGLFSKGLYKPGMLAAGSNAALQAREKVSLVTDIRTNSLIVSASRENFAVIDEIIRKVDAAGDFGEMGDVRIFTMKNADATKLSDTLQKFFDAKRSAEQQTGASGRSLSVSIVADARTNTLLVAGSRESFRAVEAMIDRLDGEQRYAGDFQVFYLTKATAAAIQPMIQSLFDKRVTRGETKDPVTVIADAKVNALIVGAAPQDMEMVRMLIARLDIEPAARGRTVQVYPLHQADATATANTIRGLYQSQGVPDTALPGISVDERINAIVVAGGQADQEHIADLIRQLDTETVARVTEIRVFTLEHADATELSKLLTEALTNKPKAMTDESQSRQNILQFITQRQDGRQVIARALQEGVLITPDARTNSLVVSAPSQFMNLLDSLIRKLDTTVSTAAQIRVFTLNNADCQRMGQVLTELFRLQQSTPSDMRSVNYTLAASGPDGKAATVNMGTVAQRALSVTVDVRTNSLLVGGTDEYVEMVGRVINELDSVPAQERVTKVYRLRNARALDIESALTSFLDQERQRLTSTLGTDGLGAVQRLLEREVAVVAVKSTNSQGNEVGSTLLISASPRYFKTIYEVIQELDRPPAQVLIQVMLAEVQLTDETDLGIDWNFNASIDGTQVDAGTNLGVGANIGNTGFNLQVSSHNLNFFLRALQAQGRTEILSRPQILAADNEEAFIHIGQDVPFLTDVRISEEGTTLSTVQYQEVGTILRVLPRIGDDGTIRLEVNPEISSLSESTVQISPGLNATVINRRTAKTTVTVQDGQTIIIGGLITTEDSKREDKVPILGDIPGLGWLFKRSSIVKDRTELLIILTPHVLRTVEQADQETTQQFRGLNLLGEMETTDVLKQKALQPIQTVRRAGETPRTGAPGLGRDKPESLELLPRLEEQRSLDRTRRE